MIRMLALMLALAGEAVAQESGRQEVPEEGFSLFRLVPPKPLDRGPARISSNSLLHGMFGFLPLESARTLEEWRLDVGIYEDVSRGKLDVVTDEYFLHYDATLMETNFEIRLGLPAGFEARLGLDVSELLEEDGKIVLERAPGVFLIEPDERHWGTGDLRVAVKKSFAPFGIVVGVKIPLPTDGGDLLTSQGFDLAASLLFTHDFGPVSLHLNLGAILPGGAQVFGEEVDTRAAFTFGAAVVYQFAEWGLGLIQLQGNQSLFGSVGVLDDWVATVHVGGRFRIGSYFLEASLGMGIDDRSSRWVATMGFVVPFGGGVE